jgi:hypothetical protein
VLSISLAGDDSLTGACVQSDRCRSSSKLRCVPLWFVCSCVGWKCGLFLGSVALQWLCGLGKLEKFEVEVISGFQPCSSC